MTDTYLFTDKETTGFKRSGQLIQNGQARVCQTAMVLTDDRGKILTSFSTLVKPDDWVISDGAYAVNGIEQRKCELHGMPQANFVYLFLTLAQKATQIVAHNEVFDKGMMEIEIAYLNPQEKNLVEDYKMTPWFCTMKNNAGIPGGKSLENCLRHHCDKKLEDAHDAMADTMAVRDIFFAMRGIKL